MCYTYDKNSRVVEKYEYDKYDTADEWEREYYTYDKAGNITESYVDCGMYMRTYDTNNRLTKSNTLATTYDADGNIISAGLGYQNTLAMTYDSANRLISAGENTYTYNAEDVRIRNLCGEDDTKYVYDTNARLSRLLVREKNGVVTKYIYGRGLIGEESAGVYKTYHFDYRGSTVAITDICGNVTDTFKYDTYGELDSRTGTTDTPFMYNGRDGVVTDANGLLYMRARYYSPILMRFVNADIVAGDISNAITLNRYAYANGNPVSNVDPLGLDAQRSGDSWSESYFKTMLDNNAYFYSGQHQQEQWKVLFELLKDTTEDVIEYFKTLYNDLSLDYENYKKYGKDNTDIEAVYKSKYFSSYKETLVIDILMNI